MCQIVNQAYPTLSLLAHFKELEKRDPLHHLAVQLLVKLVEEELSQANIKEFRLLPVSTDKLESNFVAVASSEENFWYPFIPRNRETTL